MSHRLSLLTAALAATVLAACQGSIHGNPGQGGSAAGGQASGNTTGGVTTGGQAGGNTTSGNTTGGSGGNRTDTGGSTTGESGGDAAADCASCTAGQRCDVLNACLLPPVPYVCVACEERPFCGADGKIYESDCAAVAAGQGQGYGSCTAPAGFYRCGDYYCDATSEDCSTFDPVPAPGFTENRCVPCSSSTGRVCGDDGVVYDDACALLQAGHHRGSTCPGFVSCGIVSCDTSTSTCETVFVGDCEGGAVLEVCKPKADAGG